jgi:hypothetical protein
LCVERERPRHWEVGVD